MQSTNTSNAPTTSEPNPKPSIEEINQFKELIDKHWNHVENVRTKAKKLINRLIDEGEFEIAQKLANRASKHDASKFTGIEFKILADPECKNELKLAVMQHQLTNDHHPEHFSGGIKAMNCEQLAELVCDWAARSSEAGTDLRQWIKSVAMPQYDFNINTKVYRKIKKFVDLLLDPKLKKLN